MTKETIQYKNIIAGISVFMLLLAIPRLPYGYYILLRWVVSATALFSAWATYEYKCKFWVFVMGGIAILFNPIIPVHLTKDIWVIIDLIVAILFLVSIFKIKPKTELPKEEKVQDLEKEQRERDNYRWKSLFTGSYNNWSKSAEERNEENLLEFIDEEEIIKVYQERLDYLWEFNKP